MGIKIDLKGSSLLGVFSACNDSLLLLPDAVDRRRREQLEDALRVEAVSGSISGSSVVGCLVQMNNHGAITSRYIFEREMAALETHIKTARLPDKMTAAGNIILANDSAALVHPELSDKAVRVVAETLGVDVKRGTIAGIGTVGMAAVANSRGLLVHPGVTDEEIGVLEELFNLPIDVGTVNFGSPLVGSGLLANAHGYAVGLETTGPEIGRIEDALGYL
jgi:translation initiation factor 6